MDKVFDFLKTLEWTTEDFLKHLFAPKSRLFCSVTVCSIHLDTFSIFKEYTNIIPYLNN